MQLHSGVPFPLLSFPLTLGLSNYDIRATPHCVTLPVNLRLRHELVPFIAAVTSLPPPAAATTAAAERQRITSQRYD